MVKKDFEAESGVMPKKFLGRHLIAEFWDSKMIEDPKKLEKVLVTAAVKANNTPLKAITYKFHPKGITGVVLLSESHIALHSWPEFEYMAIDIYTCGKKTNPLNALEYLKKIFNPKRIEIQEIKRGKIDVSGYLGEPLS
ncbi:MAG: adenosylmethionine decarboxylase [Candidatus Omnitrophica bacterium]|jgi:S-adenosylmethionine decarboxylase|nr:adenosylmethionine decarboxylase [Candidatus Omnitrophota bacterium]